MSMNRKITSLTVAVMIIAIIGSALAVSVTFTAATNARPEKFGPMFSQLRGGMALPTNRNFSAPRHWNYSRSVNVTIDSAQAKAVVNAAVPSFSVGEAKDRGNMWAVNIAYNGTVVMNVPLGKVNTPTSSDAVKAVQDSMGKGWSTGEPKQLRFIYNVPIIDASGNVIGYILVNGVTGHIATGFSLLRNGHALQK